MCVAAAMSNVSNLLKRIERCHTVLCMSSGSGSNTPFDMNAPRVLLDAAVDGSTPASVAGESFTITSLVTRIGCLCLQACTVDASQLVVTVFEALCCGETATPRLIC